MTVSSFLFQFGPLLALLCNLFLLLTLLTAKKSRLIYSYMGLLGAFILWSAGALFMRMQLYPGVAFWWKVSITGVFLVPYLYFLLVYHYAGRKGWMLKLVWGLCTLAALILNLLDVFIASPQVSVLDSGERFSYTIHWASVFPVLMAVGIFFSVWRMIRVSIKKDGVPFSYFRPLCIGVAIMVAGVLLNMIPALSTLPNDTTACAVNAVFIYYALYKKRLYARSQFTSRGATYLMSAVLTTAALIPSFRGLERAFETHFARYAAYKTLVIALLFALLAMLIFSILNALHRALFVKDQIARENQLKEFSMAVSRTLDLQEIVDVVLEQIRAAVPVERTGLYLYDGEKGCYSPAPGTASLTARRSPIPEENPLIAWLRSHERGMLYTEFTRTAGYKSMWEAEKRSFREMQVAYVLPVRCDESLVGLALLGEKADQKAYSYDEINYLESIASIASIAVKNANLYDTIHQEAQRDSLTGLYNRRYFNARLEEDFAQCRQQTLSVLLFNLDDFHLYNELYGSSEGDQMLQRFAALLRNVFGSKGTLARYGGKEFAVILPYTDAGTAYDYAQQVRERLQQLLESEAGTFRRFLTFSAGLCTSPVAASNPKQLISNANMAVYAAKKDGKNKINVYNAARSGEEPAAVGKSKVSIGQEYTATIYALTAAIDAKDHYTFNHSMQVSIYASKLAQAAGLDAEHVEIIRQAGLLHDIGKIGIPDAILTKSGKLTDEEHAIMRQHVERSIQMIRHLPSLDYVTPAVLGHHERYDGRGYPRGIAGESIPIGARCLAIADSFDAMVSRRSYKSSMPLEQALGEIRRNLGSQFDPKLGQLFIDLVENGGIQVCFY